MANQHLQPSIYFPSKELCHFDGSYIEDLVLSKSARILAVRSTYPPSATDPDQQPHTSVSLYDLVSGRFYSTISGINSSFSDLDFIAQDRIIVLASFREIVLLSIGKDHQLSIYSKHDLPRYVMNRVKLFGNLLVRYVSDRVTIWTVEPFRQIIQFRNLMALSCFFDPFFNKLYFKIFKDDSFSLVYFDLSYVMNSDHSKSQVALSNSEIRPKFLCSVDQREFSLEFNKNGQTLGIIGSSFLIVVDPLRGNKLRAFDLNYSHLQCIVFHLHPAGSMPKGNQNWSQKVSLGPQKNLELSESSENQDERIRFFPLLNTYAKFNHLTVSIFRSCNGVILQENKEKSRVSSSIIRFARPPLRRKRHSKFFSSYD